jgi:hypothetical protein
VTTKVLKQARPYLILLTALFLFMFPVLLDRTLTNFSDVYAAFPWTEHRPAGWFHSNSLDGTPIYLFNPSDLLNRELLHLGQALAWNPYVGLGAPWFANMQSATYFPGKLIPMLWPDYWKGQDVMLVALLFLAGVGNFLLLRSMGVARGGATFGGLAYMLCERLFLVINMPSFTIECLLPMMLYAIHEMVRRRSPGFMLLAGALGGAQFLAGFPETSFVFSSIAAAFFVLLLWRDFRSGGEIKTAAAYGFIAAGLALVLSAFQLVEFARFLPLAETSHTTNYGSVVKEPFWLLPLLLPNFFGTPLQSYWITQISPYDHMPPSLFCGISTVLLAIMGLCWHDAPNRALMWFFAALLFVFVGYDYGFPILRYVGYLPFIDLMSTAWNAFVIPFTLSVLAGFGFQSLCVSGASSRLSIAIFVYAIALFALLFFVPALSLYPASHAFVPALLALPAFVAAFVLIQDVSWMRVGALLFLILITAESYLCVGQLAYLHYFGPRPVELPSLAWLRRNIGHDRMFGTDGIYPANMLMSSRIRDIRHFDAMYSKLYVAYAAAIWPGASKNVYQIGNPEWQSVRDPLLDLAAVKYFVTKRNSTMPDGLSEAYADSDVAIYRSESTLPRARFADRVISLPEGFTPLDIKKIVSELRTGVVLEGYLGPRVTKDCDGVLQTPVDYVLDDVAQVNLKLNAPCDGFVVLADLFFPGWMATVNGRDATIYKADYAFRAVAVKAGLNEIAMAYRPLDLQFGGPLAIVSWAGVLLFGGFFAAQGLRSKASVSRRPSTEPIS